MALFQSAVLQKYLSGLNEDEVNESWETFAAHFHNPVVQQNIRDAREEAYQEGFLDDLFVKVLGYTRSPAPDYNLVAEQKNLTDSKKADGALLDGNKVRGVIELKGTETTDLSRVETQAFGYKNKQPEALYVIISNFEKLRFYIDKLSRKLQSWHELTFRQFLKELKKKKVELTLSEEAEWMEYFNEQKAKADELKAQIVQTDQEIDGMVYELYGLGEEEVKVVEGVDIE